MVVHLLVFGRIVPQQRAACHHKVGACRVERFIDQEVFLLPTQVANHFLDFGIEILSHSRSGAVNRIEGLLQGHLVVERLTRVGDEYRGNHQCVADDKHRRSGVPGTVATGLKRAADAAVRKR